MLKAWVGGEWTLMCRAWQRTRSCSLDQIKFGSLCTRTCRIFDCRRWYVFL